jgi:hypothetical protein
VRRVIAPIAAALLALTIAGPVAADPIVNNPQSHLYVIVCGDVTTYQNSYGVPGWDASWAPGDTPWLLMSYTLTLKDGGGVFTEDAPRGLDGNGKLYGPCTIDGADGQAPYSISNAYFLRK